MIDHRKLNRNEMREKISSSIIETLGGLPESQKKMFVWRHYCGWPVEKIAGALTCSISEVDRTLRCISSMISLRATQLLA